MSHRARWASGNNREGAEVIAPLMMYVHECDCHARRQRASRRDMNRRTLKGRQQKEAAEERGASTRDGDAAEETRKKRRAGKMAVGADSLMGRKQQKRPDAASKRPLLGRGRVPGAHKASKEAWLKQEIAHVEEMAHVEEIAHVEAIRAHGKRGSRLYVAFCMLKPGWTTRVDPWVGPAWARGGGPRVARGGLRVGPGRWAQGGLGSGVAQPFFSMQHAACRMRPQD